MSKGRHVCLSPAEFTAAWADTELATACLTHPQQELVNSLGGYDMAVFDGGNFGGKSYLGGFLVGSVLVGSPWTGGWAPVPARVGVVGPSWEQMRDAIFPYLQHFIPEWMIHRKRDPEGVWQWVQLCNGSVLTLLTGGMKVDVHAGKRLNLLWYDEQPVEAHVNEGLFRFKAGAELKKVIAMTPIHGKSWVYDRLVRRAAELEIKHVEASIFENGVCACQVCGGWDKPIMGVAHAVCTCAKKRWRIEPCQTCHKTRADYDAVLEDLGLIRKTPGADRLCGRCRSFGVEPRISPGEIQKIEKRFRGDPNVLAMRLHGSWEIFDGQRCLTDREISVWMGSKQPPLTHEQGIAYWAKPVAGHRYVMGVDGAAGGGDETVVVVLDVTENTVVAMWTDHEARPEAYLDLIVMLSEEYGHASVCLENIGPGYYLIPKLAEMGVPLTRQRRPDRRGPSQDKWQYGVQPNPRSQERIKQQLVAACQHAIRWTCACHDQRPCPLGRPCEQGVLDPTRTQGVLTFDDETIEQIGRLVYNAEEHGKIRVTSGHDDRVFALALAVEGAYNATGGVPMPVVAGPKAHEDAAWAELERLIGPKTDGWPRHPGAKRWL